MHGSKTPKEKIEKGLDNAIVLGSINAGAKSVGLAPSTLYENIPTDIETAEQRRLKTLAFCNRLEPTLDKLIKALEIKVSDADALNKATSLRNITGAISEIRRSMETAVNILNIQVKTGVASNPTPILGGRSRMTEQELDEQICKWLMVSHKEGDLKVYDLQNNEVQLSKIEYIKNE